MAAFAIAIEATSRGQFLPIVGLFALSLSAEKINSVASLERPVRDAKLR